MDPHFSRKLTPSLGQEAATSGLGQLFSAVNGSALWPGGGGGERASSLPGEVGAGPGGSAPGGELAGELADELNQRMHLTLACARHLLRLPEKRDIVRGVIGKTTARAPHPNNNFSTPIELLTLDGYFPTSSEPPGAGAGASANVTGGWPGVNAAEHGLVGAPSADPHAHHHHEHHEHHHHEHHQHQHHDHHHQHHHHDHHQQHEQHQHEHQHEQLAQQALQYHLQLAGAANQTSASGTYVDLLALIDGLPAIQSDLPLDALSYPWQVLLVVIYSLTAIASFLLNMITVVVLSRCQRTELRKYLINLSLSDLLMSMFSIPFTYTEYMLGKWLFGAFFCPVIRFVVTLSVFVSIATMTIIGINRHLAIMYPLKRRNSKKWRHWTFRNKTHVIVGIWVLGTAISLPEYLSFSQKPFCYNKLLHYECRNTWPEVMANSYTIFLFFSTFAVPLVLLSYLYTSIGLKLWRRQMPGNVDVNRDLTMQTKRAKVVKMLLVVVAMFALMWLPLQTFNVVTFLFPDWRANDYGSANYTLFVATYFACHWLAMAHSCVSPLVYCFMNKKFRTDLRNLLCPLRALVRANGQLAAAKGAGHEFSQAHNSSATPRTSHLNLLTGSSSSGPGGRAGAGGGGASGASYAHSNSVRVRASSSNNASQASRQLSKASSLSSLRASNRLASQASNGPAASEAAPAEDAETEPTASAATAAAAAIASVNRAPGTAAQRSALMGKLSETSATETLRGIDEEAEDADEEEHEAGQADEEKDQEEGHEHDDDDDDDEEEDDDDDENDDDNGDDNGDENDAMRETSLEDGPRKGRAVTIRRQERGYAILERAAESGGASPSGEHVTSV